MNPAPGPTTPGERAGGHWTPGQVGGEPTPSRRDLALRGGPATWPAGPAVARATAGAGPEGPQAAQRRPLVSTGTCERSVAPDTVGVPRYVRACVNSPYPDAPYILRLWLKGTDPASGLRRPHRCGSWRCDGQCARYRASVDFARLSTALEDEPARDLVFIVLTLDQRGTYSGEAWADPWTAYRSLSRMTRDLLARLRRLHPDIGSRWVGVVEAHRSGWPHFNLVLASASLASALRAERAASYQRGIEGRDAILVRGALLGAATGTGWGPQSTAEAARDETHAADRLAGYVLKLARGPEAGRLAGEARKLSQVPDVAPQGFRRIRSGRGFLPPRRRAEGWTGALLGRRGDSVWAVGRRGRRPTQDRIAAVERAVITETHVRLTDRQLLPEQASPRTPPESSPAIPPAPRGQGPPARPG